MLYNYLKVCLRNIFKYKVFSFINIFGLAMAMSICMLIILMLADQRRYDDFHANKDRIYRILSNTEGSRQPYATSPQPLAETLKQGYPVVENSTHLTPGVLGDVVYQRQLINAKGYFADDSFFDVFSFELKDGDPQEALSKPNSMVITAGLARKLFKDEDPIGKIVDFSDRQAPFNGEYAGLTSLPWGSFTVTGVLDETLYKSHLEFDVLISESSASALIAAKKIEDRSRDWEWYFRTYTFVVLRKDKSREDLQVALNDLVKRQYATLTAEHVKGFSLAPQSLADVQLGLYGNDTNNRMPKIGYYFLVVLAIVIMLSACMNYTNLSVARALTRAKEIGVRKVTGAVRKNLIVQFLSESVLTSLLALAMAMLFLLFVVPSFKGLWVNQYLKFELPVIPEVYLFFTVFAVLVGLVAGVYPALYLSTYAPLKAIKNVVHVNRRQLNMRKVVGVSQFVLSLFFISTSVLIYNQFRHYLTFDYGFQHENVINIDLQGVRHEALMNELKSLPEVTGISACDIIPAAGVSNNNQIRKVGSTDEFKQIGIIHGDENFVPNLGVELIAGRPLSSAGESADRYVLVNESAVRSWGYSSPSAIVGEVFESKWGDEKIEVAGVVKDFRYKLLINEDAIGPLLIRNKPSEFKYLNVRLSSSDWTSTIGNLEKTWKRFDPLHPFEYEFFTEQLESTHQALLDVVSILGFVALLAIVIACLGLLGMAVYTAERKAKEVGIRKVLGAEERSIAWLLSRGFLKMLMISVLIGVPLSYVVNSMWLQVLPNRVGFGVSPVLWSVSVLLTLGLLTIGSQTIRASRSNPVDVLKME